MVTMAQRGTVFGSVMKGLGSAAAAAAAVILILIVGHVEVTSAAKILLTRTCLLSVPSHYMGLTTLTQALVSKGHNVTLLTMDGLGTKGFLPGSYTANITYPNPKSKDELAHITRTQAIIMGNIANMTFWDIFGKPEWREFPKLTYFGCFELFKHDSILARLKAENIDVVLSFPVVEFCDAVIAAYLDVRFIVLTGVRRTPAYHEGMAGMPIPTSYVPASDFLDPQLSDQMGFVKRVRNFVVKHTVVPAIEYFTVHRHIGRLQALHDIRQDLTPWQIVRRLDLWLSHHSWALEYPHPMVPNWVPIAGFTIKDAKPLPEHLDDFVQGSGEHGFIVFTMGSAASLSGEQLTDMFLKVFSELPQRVLWRYGGTISRNHSNNILISDWLPQNDLLAHPKARMLIYHGGSAGLHEAIHHAVPLLLIPLIGDQAKNAHMAAAKGMALVMERNRLDEDKLRKNIQSLLQDPSFKENAVRASAILRDRVVSPLDTAVFWIEHVVKFGGDHLRVRATEMGFIELHSLDVIAFLVAILLGCAYTTCIAMMKCCSCVFKRRNEKQKND